MTTPMANGFEQALSEFERARQEIQSAQQAMATERITVTSRNREFAVTVDARGTVVDITFRGRAHRVMAAKELGALLVSTIGEAQRRSVEQTAAAFAGLLPTGLPLADLMTGTIDLDAMMDEAIARGVAEHGPGPSNGTAS